MVLTQWRGAIAVFVCGQKVWLFWCRGWLPVTMRIAVSHEIAEGGPLQRSDDRRVTGVAVACGETSDGSFGHGFIWVTATADPELILPFPPPLERQAALRLSSRSSL